jgi:hypothetical protein
MALAIHPGKRIEPMKLKRMSWRLMAASCVAMALAACDPGPFQKAGKAIDRAGEKTGDKIKDLSR